MFACHLRGLKIVKAVTAKFDVLIERLQSGIYVNTRNTTLAVSLVSTLFHDLSQWRQEMNDVSNGLRTLLRRELSVTLTWHRIIECFESTMETSVSHPSCFFIKLKRILHITIRIGGQHSQ